eukprot:NODE_1221_length_2555_cov_12.649506.p1 GENE.NODE_1221_length_2555_cov_12.649506~~NODE_1221_length_2555_cov_12.649506.p1  ORF type:complete len:760 (-),score=216.80 NODE_1221_length_2555_cov_12.649506:207-2486(-)
MEVTLQDAATLPENCVVSVRFGGTRRQAPVQRLLTQPFRFPASAKTMHEPIKIEIMECVADGRLVPRLNEERYRINLHDVQKPTETKHTIKMRVRALHELESEASCMQTTPEKASTAGANEYLDAHGILGYIQGLLHAVIQLKPEDPYAFMMEQLGAARPATPLGGDDGKEAPEELAPAPSGELVPPPPPPPPPPAPTENQLKEAPAAAPPPPAATEEQTKEPPAVPPPLLLISEEHPKEASPLLLPPATITEDQAKEAPSPPSPPLPAATEEQAEDRLKEPPMPPPVEAAELSACIDDAVATALQLSPPANEEAAAVEPVRVEPAPALVPEPSTAQPSFAGATEAPVAAAAVGEAEGRCPAQDVAAEAPHAPVTEAPAASVKEVSPGDVEEPPCIRKEAAAPAAAEESVAPAPPPAPALVMPGPEEPGCTKQAPPEPVLETAIPPPPTCSASPQPPAGKPPLMSEPLSGRASPDQLCWLREKAKELLLEAAAGDVLADELRRCCEESEVEEMRQRAANLFLQADANGTLCDIMAVALSSQAEPVVRDVPELNETEELCKQIKEALLRVTAEGRLGEILRCTLELDEKPQNCAPPGGSSARAGAPVVPGRFGSKLVAAHRTGELQDVYQCVVEWPGLPRSRGVSPDPDMLEVRRHASEILLAVDLAELEKVIEKCKQTEASPPTSVGHADNEKSRPPIAPMPSMIPQMQASDVDTRHQLLEMSGKFEAMQQESAALREQVAHLVGLMERVVGEQQPQQC